MHESTVASTAAEESLNTLAPAKPYPAGTNLKSRRKAQSPLARRRSDPCSTERRVGASTNDVPAEIGRAPTYRAS